jgi:hypothetical protein
MMSWLSTLFAKAPPHTPLSRYTTYNGFFYMAAGALVFLWPRALELTGPALVGHEPGFARMLGAVLLLIGWFYVFGAKTRSDVFGLATVFDRLFLVPLLFLPLVALGEVDPAVGVPFAILDPLLGIGALLIWRRQRRMQTTAAE